MKRDTLMNEKLYDAYEILIFLYSYVMPLVSTLYVLSPKPYVVAVGMNIVRETTKRNKNEWLMLDLMTTKFIHNTNKCLHLSGLINLWFLLLSL